MTRLFSDALYMVHISGFRVEGFGFDSSKVWPSRAIGVSRAVAKKIQRVQIVGA